MADIVSNHVGTSQTVLEPAAASTLISHTPDPSKCAPNIYINYLDVFSGQPLNLKYF